MKNKIKENLPLESFRLFRPSCYFQKISDSHSNSFTKYKFQMLRLSWAWIVESSKDSKDDRPLGRIKKVPCWYGTTFCPNALNCQAASCPYRHTKLFAKNLFKIYRYIRISFRREFLTVFASGKAKDTVFSLHGHHTFLHKYRNVKKVLYLSFTGNKIRFYF